MAGLAALSLAGRVVGIFKLARVVQAFAYPRARTREMREIHSRYVAPFLMLLQRRSIPIEERLPGGVDLLRCLYLGQVAEAFKAHQFRMRQKVRQGD